MARSLSRSSDGASDKGERLEPRLLRATESDDLSSLSSIIYTARETGKLHANFLRIAVMRAAEKNKIAALQFLLKAGASPNGAPGKPTAPLLKAVEKNHVTVIGLLLEASADPNVADKQGRTALMTAAWKNHYHVLNLLLAKGADANARDNERRNVLHNLAADKHCNWGKDVIDLLLRSDVCVDGADGQDDLKRTPLHWACVTGKKDLAEWLLMRARGRANVHAVEIREKTPLHLAVSHDREDIVEMLLRRFGANANAKSDGAWTPLHNACEKGSEKIVRLLLEERAELNARLLNGMTPLHVAAQAGHLEIVKILLERPDIKRAARDNFGITPFLRAAQNRRKDIVRLLAPFNHVEGMSEDALGACNGFNATIVEFGNFHNENRVRKCTVYELLYGKDPINSRIPAVTILPKDSKATNFRWIHLPANNMAWVEALLTKAFIEEGASDVEGFKALERSFSHQHRGQQIHSHFMRPLCQSTPRAPKYADDSDFSDPPAGETGPPRIVINDVTISKTEAPPSTPVKGSSTPVKGITPEGERSDRSKGQNSKDTPKGPKEKGEKPKKSALKGGKNAKEAPKEPQRPHYTRKPALDSRHLRSPGSPGRKDATMTARGNIFTFMPYLHFETDGRRQEMQQAIKRAETLKSEGFRPVALRKAATYDEMLIRAHLSSSSVSLHVRRTLDQFFYHNIDTQGRDQDQVVYRYQKRARALASHAAHSNTKDIEDDHPIDPKIFMVDQLWMWVLGKDLIVTSFPQRWQQPKNDPLNVLDGVIEDINSKTREPLRSVYELALLITGRCSGVFDRHRMGDEEYQFLDMFESSIGSATDRETMLFKEFNTASAQASAWLQHHRRPNRFSRHLEATHRNYEHTAKKGITPKDLDNREAYSSDDDEIQERFHYDDPTHGPLFVDKLLDIGAETDLLAETKDIRDELNMISKVLEDQRNVLPDLELSILEIFSSEHKSQLEIKKRCREQLKTIEMHVKDLERMDKQAERIYASITDLLDLKQKHANAFEARFARDQAAGTARQSQTIMVFTIVTIIFLPLSFIAAFFTINIREFPRLQDGTEALPLGYVSKYMFGIGFAISIPMIVIALSLDDIGDYAREAKRRLRQWKHRRRARRLGKGPDVVSEKVDALELLRLEQVLSARKSVEDGTELDWGEGLLPVASRGTAGSGLGKMNGGAGAGVNGIETVRKVNTGFRIRTSRDVERGF